MDHHLDGKRVVIIGGSSGIGLETPGWGRIGRPEEVAAAVIFLMSNGFVTGKKLAKNMARLLSPLL